MEKNRVVDLIDELRQCDPNLPVEIWYGGDDAMEIIQVEPLRDGNGKVVVVLWTKKKEPEGS